jgi:hypothetical protein
MNNPTKAATAVSQPCGELESMTCTNSLNIARWIRDLKEIPVRPTLGAGWQCRCYSRAVHSSRHRGSRAWCNSADRPDAVTESILHPSEIRRTTRWRYAKGGSVDRPARIVPGRAERRRAEMRVVSGSGDGIPVLVTIPGLREGTLTRGRCRRGIQLGFGKSLWVPLAG